MIDHINIGVADLTESQAFYERALAPLGYALMMVGVSGVGFGRDGKPDFWISNRPPSGPLIGPLARVCVTPASRPPTCFAVRARLPPCVRPGSALFCVPFSFPLRPFCRWAAVESIEGLCDVMMLGTVPGAARVTGSWWAATYDAH